MYICCIYVYAHAHTFTGTQKLWHHGESEGHRRAFSDHRSVIFKSSGITLKSSGVIGGHLGFIGGFVLGSPDGLFRVIGGSCWDHPRAGFF